MMTFSQIPNPPAGAIESWLISGVAVVSIAALIMKVFVRKPPIEAEFVSRTEFRMFREGVERELYGLRDRIDARFLSVVEKMEQMKAELLAEGERRAGAIQQRLNEMEAGLARVDERTKR